MRTFEDRVFLALVVTASLGFGWILWPFCGAILWSVVAAIVFAPLYRRLSQAMHQRHSLAAIATIMIIVTLIILPLTLVSVALAREASSVYGRVQSAELDFVRSFQHILDGLPHWMTSLLGHFDLAILGVVQEKLSRALLEGSQFLAAQTLDISQRTFGFFVNLFVMLYLLFFLFRDENTLSKRVIDAIPLRPGRMNAIWLKFTILIRATVRGSLLVALLQGALGGLMFWLLGINAPLLWAVLTAFLSLLPAIGSGLVWVPVAVYLLATGAIWQGVVLIAFGAIVIGVVDNWLRPMLTGKGAKMPNYVVFFSTLGGIETFGINGFVIGPVTAAMFMAAWEISFGVKQKE
jgi:predicted PurR-regulated permease PerM